MLTEANETSLTAAEEYVLENLRRDTHEVALSHGDQIEVDCMNDCDCIPLVVGRDGQFSQEGCWRLVSCRTKTWGRFSGWAPSISATYEYRLR